MPLSTEFQLLLEEEEQRKAGIDTSSNLVSLAELREAKAPPVPREQKNALLDMVGSAVWGFAEEGSFGLAGYLIPEEEREKFVLLEDEPETRLGKLGMAIGSLGGFIAGAPMKIGTKIATTAARPFIKGATTAGLLKTTQKAVKASKVSHSAQKFSKEAMENVIKGSANTARWDAKIAKNWPKHAGNNIDNAVKDGIRMGKITKAEGEVIGNLYKTNFKKRPVQDFIDIMLKQYAHNPKKGFVIGHMLHGAATFGAIDAIFEASHSFQEGREYDWSAPLWGVGVGAGFGTLRMMKPKGKASMTSEDLKSGIRTIFKRNPWKNMDYSILEKHAKWLGRDMEKVGHSTTIKYGGKGQYVDLLNPSWVGNLTRAEKTQALEIALNKVKFKYGRQMLSSAAKNELESMAVNWQHMVAGSAMMNARSILAITQGAEVDPQDILTSIVIGAWLNRKGMPKTKDMRSLEMSRLRRGLHTMGISNKNMLNDFPSLHDAKFEWLDPMKNPEFNSIREFAEERHMLSNEEILLDRALPEGEVSAEVSQKDLSLFKEIHPWLKGSSGKRYLMSKDHISERDALALQDFIRSSKFEGHKIENAEDLRDLLKTSSDKITDMFEKELVTTLEELLKPMDAKLIIDAASENLGRLPTYMNFTTKLKTMAEEGKFPDILGNGEAAVHELSKLQAKLDNILSSLTGVGRLKRSTNTSDTANIPFIYEMSTEAELRGIYDALINGEARINEHYINRNVDNRFEFSKLDEMNLPLQVRYFHRTVAKIEDLFDSDVNPSWVNLKELLVKTGVLVPQGPGKGFGLVSDFSKIQVDYGKTDENGLKGIEGTNLLKSMIAILGAKGKGFEVVDTRDVPNTPSYQSVVRLQEYLNENGMLTDPVLLDMFRNQVVETIMLRKMGDANLTDAHVALVSELMAYDTPLAAYATGADGGAGYILSKVESIGRTEADSKIAEYNLKVDEIIKAGTQSDKSRFIKPGDVKVLKDPSSVDVLKDLVDRITTEQGKASQETLFDLIKAIDPTDTLRDSFSVYLKLTQNPDRLITMMRSNGIITTKRKKTSIEYLFKTNDKGEIIALKNKKTRQELYHWLDTHGVRVADIEKLYKDNAIRVEKLIEVARSGSSKITQQSFFEKYFPAEGKVKQSIYIAAEKQQELLDGTIYDFNGSIKDTAVNDLLVKMSVPNTKLTGKDVLTDLKTHSVKYEQMYDDVVAIMSNRVGSMGKEVLSYNRGNITSKPITMQRTRLTEYLDTSGIPYIFVDGLMNARINRGTQYVNKFINVFDVDSERSLFSAEERTKYTEEFNRALSRFSFKDPDLNMDRQGITVIRLGNAKQAIGISKEHAKSVAQLFKKEIYDVYYEKAGSKDQKTMADLLQSLGFTRNKKTKELEYTGTELWTGAHTEVMRSMILRNIVVGKKNDRYLDLLSAPDSEIKNLAKRISLFHTPSFAKHSQEFTRILSNASLTKKDRQVLRGYADANKVGIIQWNDTDRNGLEQTSEKWLAKRKLKWESVLGQRKNVSAFDSISFISGQYKRYLELRYGRTSEGAGAFKPVISSGGEEFLMLGKTVFVYDPTIQEKVFSKNGKIDILMSRTADKINSSRSRAETNFESPTYIDKSIEEILEMGRSELSEYIFELPLDAVGISMIPHNEMLAKQSQSLYNYMDSREAGEMFGAHYVERIAKASRNINEIMGNPMLRNLAVREMNNLGYEVDFEGLGSSQEALDALGYQLQWSALHELSDPSVLGENILLNKLKARLLDPIIDQTAMSSSGMEYGGKSVIKQSMKYRELEGSTIKTDVKGKKRVQRGDVVLPYHIYDKPIKFAEADNLEMRVVNKQGSVLPIKSTIVREIIKANKNELYKDMSNEQINELLDSAETVGQLYENIAKLTDGQFHLGILTSRYPRTTPNDLAILRLKGFLSKEEGNTMVVNDWDVFNIFEGDYDVDEVDFFFAGHGSMYKNVDRVSHLWNNTVNPEIVAPPRKTELKLLDSNFEKNERNWNSFDADNRVFQSGIGIVQKSLRTINHLKDLGVINEETGNYTLFTSSDKAGKGEYIVELMYDNKDWFARTALEAQLIIDYWGGVSHEIVDRIPLWKPEYLFDNKGTKSLSEFSSTERNVNDFASNIKNNTGKRIQLFRKVDLNGAPVELTKLDREIILTMLKEHSNFLQLGTKTYSGGIGKTPGYNEIMDYSVNFFKNHLQDINKSIFMKLQSRYGEGSGSEKQFKAMFKPKWRAKAWVRRAMQKQPHEKGYISDQEVKDKKTAYSYKWFTTSPFLQGVEDNANLIYRGQRGSVFDRSMNKIWEQDVLHKDKDKGRMFFVPEGNLLKDLEAMHAYVLGDQGYKIDEMRSLLPALGANIKKTVSSIRYYKGILKNLDYNTRLSYKQKIARQENLSKIVLELEADIMPLLTQKYLETRDPRLLQEIEYLNVQTNREVREATTNLWTMQNFVENAHLNKKGGDSLKEAIAESAKVYSELNDAKAWNKYGTTTIRRPEDTEAALTIRTREETEQHLMDQMSNQIKVQKHGLGWLYHYMSPNNATDTSLQMGVFGYRAIPISVKPNGRFARGIKWLLREHNMSTDPNIRADLKQKLTLLSKRHSAYKNYFEMRKDFLTVDDTELFHNLHNIPGFGSRLNSFADHYSSIRLDKSIQHKDIFGMGREYSDQMRLFRQIAAATGQKDKADKLLGTESRKGELSYINTLVMENGYMDPYSYMLHMDRIREELADLGGDQIFKGEFSRRYTNETSTLSLLRGAGDTFTLRPMKVLSGYRMNMMKRFLQQSRDIKMEPKEETWNENFKERKEVGPCDGVDHG